VIPRFDCFDYVRPKFACLNKAVVKRDSAAAVDHPRPRPRDAMIARFMLSSCVCPSVCPSQVGVVSKRLDESIWVLANTQRVFIGVAFAWPIMDEHDVVHKPEVDNVSQRRRRRTESWRQVTCFAKFGEVWIYGY